MNIAESINKKKLTQKVFSLLLLFVTLIVIVFVFGIIIYLIVKGGSALTWEFLTQKNLWKI